MKLIFTTFIVCISFCVLGQTTTNYGTFSGTLGTDNSFFGYVSGTGTVNGANSFFGAFTGRHNKYGYNNCAFGSEALYYNTDGFDNTAIGRNALYTSNGNANTALGSHALYKNKSSNNTAIGIGSMNNNSTGFYNTAVGGNSLWQNVTGSNNVSVGGESMWENTSGTGNTAVGFYSLWRNKAGSQNVAIGWGANVGMDSLENAVAIGAFSQVNSSNTVVLGNYATTQIGGPVPWSVLSDGRFKKDVQEDVPGLEFINKLRPVTYSIKESELADFSNVPEEARGRLIAKKVSVKHTGFIAQEVEKIVEEMDIRFSGVEKPTHENDAYAIRYSEFIMPLVKAVQQLSNKVDAQQKLIAQLSNDSALLEELDLQKNQLLFNSPNPFLNKTTFQLVVLDEAQEAQLIIHDLEGRAVKTLDITNRGKVSIDLSSEGLNESIYIYKLVVDGEVIDAQRMVLKK